MVEAGQMSENDLEEFLNLVDRRTVKGTELIHQIECLGIVGYGIAPDPRFIIWIDGTETPMYLYRIKSSKKHPRFVNAAEVDYVLELSLAVIISNSKKGNLSLSPKELEMEVSHWRKSERLNVQRYRCHLNWLLKNPPRRQLIPKIINHMDDIGVTNFFNDIGRYIIVNGFIPKHKLAVIEKIYEESGFEHRTLLPDLKNNSVKSSREIVPLHQKELTKRRVNYTTVSKENVPRGKEKKYRISIEFAEKQYPDHLSVDRLSSIDKKEKNYRLQWISNDSYVYLGGRRVKGMIYLGTLSELDQFDRFYCSSCIDPFLEIAFTNYQRETSDPSNILSYRSFSINQRAGYLEWLATNRTDKRYNREFPELYLKGLEYRFFVDKPNIKEKREILKEAKRIVEFYELHFTRYRSFQNFIDFAHVLTTQEDLEPNIYAGRKRSLLPTIIAISQKIAKQESISADWCLRWYVNQPDIVMRSSFDFIANIFVPLFRNVFNMKYPKGYIVKRPERNLETKYVSSSLEFTQTFEFTMDGEPMPDVSSLVELRRDMEKLVEEVSLDMAPLTKFYWRMNGNIESLEAMKLVPDRVKDDVWNTKLSFLKDWIASNNKHRGCTLDEFCDKLEGKKRQKISYRQYEEISCGLGCAGYGLTPDPRLLSRAPKMDERVLIYPINENSIAETKVRPELLDRIVEIGICVWIVDTKGKKVSLVEEAMIRHIESLPNLSANEQSALIVNLKWFLASVYDITRFKVWFGALTKENSEDLRQLAVRMVLDYGMKNKESVSRLEKLYALLGYETQQVYSDLNARKPLTDLVRVRNSKIGSKAEGKPGNRKDRKAVKLDSNKIEDLVDETEKVKDLLGTVFVEDPLSVKKHSTEKSKNPTAVPGLDEKHTLLVIEFLSNNRWTESRVQKLAKKHGLMWQGCLETINEWSFDLFKEELIEEYDGYRPNSNIVKQLKDHFQRIEK